MKTPISRVFNFVDDMFFSAYICKKFEDGEYVIFGKELESADDIHLNIIFWKGYFDNVPEQNTPVINYECNAFINIYDDVHCIQYIDKIIEYAKCHCDEPVGKTIYELAKIRNIVSEYAELESYNSQIAFLCDNGDHIIGLYDHPVTSIFTSTKLYNLSMQEAIDKYNKIFK